MRKLSQFFIFLSALLGGDLAFGAQPCPIPIFEKLVREPQKKAQEFFGGTSKCAAITSSEIAEYDRCSSVDVGVGQVAELAEQANGVAVGMFFQELAANSHAQARCRAVLFQSYEQSAAKKTKLHANVGEAFREISVELQGLALYKRELYDRFLNAVKIANDARVNEKFGLAPDEYPEESQSQIESKIRDVEAEIAKKVLTVPMGYDPDIATALVAMAEVGNFDEVLFEKAMSHAKEKYVETANYYSSKFIPTREGRGSYCLGVEFRNTAGRTGQISSFVESIPSKESGTFKEKLTCQLTTAYETGPKNLTTALTVVSFASMLFPPTAAARAAMLSTKAGTAVFRTVRLGAAVDSVMAAQALYGECFPAPAFVSGDRAKCDPERDFKHAIETPKLASCAMGAVMGLTAAAHIRQALSARRLVRPKSGSNELANGSDNVVDEIVVTGSRGRKAKPKKSSEVASNDDGSKAATLSPKPNDPIELTFHRDNPYLDELNAPQGDFLKRIGGEVDSKTVRISDPQKASAKANSFVDDAVRAGKIKESETLRLADGYVGKDGKLLWVRTGEAPPIGARHFEPENFGIKGYDEYGHAIYVSPRGAAPQASSALSDADYYAALSDGHLPGYLDKRPLFAEVEKSPSTNEASRSTPGEPSFLHDLAHMGGVLDNFEGMAGIREAAKRIARTRGGINGDLKGRMNFVNEMMTTFKPGAEKHLGNLVSSTFPNRNAQSVLAKSYKDVVSALDGVPDQKLIDIAQSITEFHKNNRIAVGGDVRTASWTAIARARLDYAASSSKHSVSSLESMNRHLKRLEAEPVVDQTKIENHNRLLTEVRQRAQRFVADYLHGAQALSEVPVRSWYRVAADNTPLEPGSPHYRFICEGAHIDPASKYFCK